MQTQLEATSGDLFTDSAFSSHTATNRIRQMHSKLNIHTLCIIGNIMTLHSQLTSVSLSNNQPQCWFSKLSTLQWDYSLRLIVVCWFPLSFYFSIWRNNSVKETSRCNLHVPTFTFFLALGNVSVSPLFPSLCVFTCMYVVHRCE